MAFEGLADDWVVWNRDERGCVFAYRPDVFDGGSFPAPCLPTIAVNRSRRHRRPDAPRPSPGDPWHVTLFLEPAVERDPERFPTREAAVEGALDLADRFARGDIDYRALYQVPRPGYLDRLDELTGRDAVSSREGDAASSRDP